MIQIERQLASLRKAYQRELPIEAAVDPLGPLMRRLLGTGESDSPNGVRVEAADETVERFESEPRPKAPDKQGGCDRSCSAEQTCSRAPGSSEELRSQQTPSTSVLESTVRSDARASRTVLRTRSRVPIERVFDQDTLPP